METEPPSTILQFLTIDASITGVAFIVVLIILLLLSALISGSEVAFFSLGAGELEELEDDAPKHNRIKTLLDKPEELLGTILISNNFVNVGIVILSTFLLNTFFSPELWSPVLTFVVEILAITGVLLLFGEILPKVYANTARLNFARFVVPFIFHLHKILKPISKRLSKTINRINIEGRAPSLSVDDLEQALELTTD